MKFVSSGLVLGLGGLLALTGLHAANADSTGALVTTFGPASVATTQTVNLTPFNTALGTLTGVVVVFSPTFQASTGVINDSGGPVVITDAFTSETLQATGPNALVVGPTTLTSDSGPISVPLANLASTNIGGAAASGSVTSPLITTGLAAYENPLTAIISVASAGVTASGTSGANNVGYFGNGDLSGSVSVDYFYTTSTTTTSTPEPGSLAMFAGMGVTGSLFAFRRRSSRK